MEYNKIFNFIIDYIYSDKQLNKTFNYYNQKIYFKQIITTNIIIQELFINLVTLFSFCPSA